MSASSAHQPTSAFFRKLPAEIRKKIYYFAFNSPTVQVYTVSPWTKNDPKLFSSFSQKAQSPIEPLFANKQFCEEALATIFLYSRFAVSVTVHENVPLGPESHVETSIAKLILTVPIKLLSVLQNIRHVEFNIQMTERGVPFNRSLVDVMPLSEMLPRLGRLRTILVTWASDKLCLARSSALLKMPRRHRDSLELIGPLGEFQKAREDVQVTIQDCRFNATAALFTYCPGWIRGRSCRGLRVWLKMHPDGSITKGDGPQLDENIHASLSYSIPITEYVEALALEESVNTNQR